MSKAGRTPDGVCRGCGKPLTDPESVRLGMGPECRKDYAVLPDNLPKKFNFHEIEKRLREKNRGNPKADRAARRREHRQARVARGQQQAAAHSTTSKPSAEDTPISPTITSAIVNRPFSSDEARREFLKYNHLVQCWDCNHVQNHLGRCEECGGRLEILEKDGKPYRK